ncbi:MAG TPA: YraN family protein [Flavisolibacter sp.]|nr:YraN family protein [Flavisolibacter sp.]
MALHNELGKEGEELAVAYLLEKGYKLLYRNWRSGRNEIDIVAIKEQKLHLVEVKCRSSERFGQPEEGVTPKKLRLLLQAADAFMYKHPQFTDFQIDIVAIRTSRQAPPDYFLIEDVYL